MRNLLLAVLIIVGFQSYGLDGEGTLTRKQAEERDVDFFTISARKRTDGIIVFRVAVPAGRTANYERVRVEGMRIGGTEAPLALLRMQGIRDRDGQFVITRFSLHEELAQKASVLIGCSGGTFYLGNWVVLSGWIPEEAETSYVPLEPMLGTRR